MALKTCPHCGKQVSDTVDVCIHCGKRIAETVPEKTAEQPLERKGYERLTDYERRELEKEFTKGKPKYDKYFGKEPYYQYVRKVSLGGDILGTAIAGVGIILEDSSPALSLVFLIVGLILLSVSVVCDVAFYFVLNNYRKKLLIILKKYQKWLMTEKGIAYVLNFKWLSDRWQRYFNGINADVEDV